MNISKVNNTSFKGLLTISGPNKNNDVIVNTKAVSTINISPYIGKDFKKNDGATLTMNNGVMVHTFVSIENIIETYKQAEANGEAKLETKYNPTMEKPLIDYI